MRLATSFLLLIIWYGVACNVNRTDEAEVAVVEPLLLVSTLDGLIYAMGQRSGIIRWTLRDEPLVRHPVRSNDSDEVAAESLLLTDPKDGSLYLLSRAVSLESGDRDQEALKKLPFTMKEVISVSPCRSSDGLLYMGRKVDSWLMIHSKTGEKVDVLDTDSPTCKRSSDPQINQKIPSIFLTKSVYQLSIFDSKTRARKWNITMVDYSSTASPSASKAVYPFLHLTSSTSGKILTVDLESNDEHGPKMLWTKDLLSPIVAMYEIDESGSMETRKVPFTTIGDDSETMTKTSVQSLYVGESSTLKQMYALSAYVSFETRLLSNKKRKLSLPLIEGPDNGAVPHAPNSKRKSHAVDYLLFGFYEYPDVCHVDLSTVLPIGHQGPNLIESRPEGLNASKHLPPPQQEHENQDVWSAVSFCLVLNVCFATSAILIVSISVKRRMRQTSTALTQLGKISFDTAAIIGRGSAGTCVYKGLFEGSAAVAVKRIVNEHCVLAQREIDLLRGLQHPNVVRYYSAESDHSFQYIAIELADLTLADLMEKRYKTDEFGISDMQILQDACRGLAHLHSVSVIHRDIKPQNILISSPVMGRRKALLSDLGVGKTLSFEQSASEILSTTGGIKGTEGWIAPEVLASKTGHGLRNEFKYSKQMDIFSMGCLAYYVFSGGSHPFGQPVERQSNILHDRSDFSDLSDEEHVGKLSLIQSMTAHKPTERPSIETVLLHPIFWSRSKQLQFLQDVSDRIEKEADRSELMVGLEIGKWDVIRGDWKRCLPDEIQAELNRHRWYPSNTVAALLRAIRNKKHHYRELSPEAQAILGEVPDHFMQYFDQKYPRLLYHCYIAMQSLRFESLFKEYYDQDSAWDFAFPRIPATGIKYFLNHSPAKHKVRGKKVRSPRTSNLENELMSKEKSIIPDEIDFENMQLKPNGGMFPQHATNDPLANWKSCARPPSTEK